MHSVRYRPLSCDTVVKWRIGKLANARANISADKGLAPWAKLQDRRSFRQSVECCPRPLPQHKGGIVHSDRERTGLICRLYIPQII